MGESAKVAEPAARINLSPAMYDTYLREIIETGGAPSIQELSAKADGLGGHGYNEESVAMSAFNSLTSLFNS